MTRRVPTALLAALCLCSPHPAWAGPPGEPAAQAANPQADGAGDPEQGAPRVDPASTPAPSTNNPEGGAPENGEATDAGTAPGQAGTPETPEITPQAGGMAGVISADDPDATKATRELEGDSLGDALPAGVPDRMSRLQRAAWWTMFGAISLGATGGVFAGLVERQEDRAVRLQRTYDLDAGARPVYDDVRAEYEGIVERGEAYEATSISLLSVGAAAFVTSVVLFSVNASRTSRSAELAAPRDRGGVSRRALTHRRGANKRVEVVSPRAGLVEVRF